MRLQISTFDELHRLAHDQKVADLLYSDLQIWFKDFYIVKPDHLDFSFSPTEKHRVQRALYLYTIWTRLFGPKYNGNAGESTSRKKDGRFLSRLPTSEIKGLIVVVGYIRSRYALYFSEIQEVQNREVEEDENLRGSASETGFKDLTPNGKWLSSHCSSRSGTIANIVPDDLEESKKNSILLYHLEQYFKLFQSISYNLKYSSCSHCPLLLQQPNLLQIANE